jgi:hypothetical protein
VSESRSSIGGLTRLNRVGLTCVPACHIVRYEACYHELVNRLLARAPAGLKTELGNVVAVALGRYGCVVGWLVTRVAEPTTHPTPAGVATWR